MLNLYEHQEQLSQQAHTILAAHNIVYLAVEMRVGKTLIGLNTAKIAGSMGVLLVTRKKAISSIGKDYAAFHPPFELRVTNYESMHKAYEGFLYDTVIIDEAHSLGQYPKPSERTKLLKKICAGKRVIYMSGTPSPESYSQLYHQFWVSDCSPWKEFPTFYKWAKEYVDVKEKWISGVRMNDYSRAKQDIVLSSSKHLFVSYTQKEAGFESFVEEQVVRIQMNKSTYWLANKLMKARVYVGKEGQEIVADSNVKLQQKLHQIYSGTVIDESGEAEVFDRSKAQYIYDHYNGKRIAIFYKFRAEFIALVSVFGANRITDDPDEYAANPELIFACNIQSGREGVNLSMADYLIMYNIDFAAVSYLQTKARLQTKDKTAPCVLIWLFAEGGIEEKVYKTVIEKMDYTIKYFQRDFRECIAVADH